MFQIVKRISQIILTVKKSRMIDFLLIILLSLNGVHNINTDFHAQQGDFNYVVSIQLSSAHLCTGTIIDETHILTIAHLVVDEPISKLSVAAGISMVMHPFFDAVMVRKVFPHPEFQRLASYGKLVEYYWVNDVAILRLAGRFYWNNNIGPVQFIRGKMNWPSCPDCVMISWAHPDQDSLAVLQMWNFVYTMSEAECRQSGIHVLQNEACFGDLLQNTLITAGKLGSPIVCDGIMIGFTVKVTENVTPGTPSTFINLLAHVGFIENVLTNAERAVRLIEFPYIVSIWDGNYHSCGGSILDKTHILTAGHCVRKSKRGNLRVASGYPETSYLNTATKWSMVIDIIYYPSHHSQYRLNWDNSHDIAILVLVKPLIFGRTINSIQYEDTPFVSPELIYQSFHWRHSLNNDRKMEVKLMTTYIKQVDNGRCKKEMKVSLSQWEFCAGNRYYMHIANSKDVGNPIIQEGRLVGIMVRAFTMDDRSPPVAVFLPLHPYEKFIHSAINGS